MAPRSLVGQKFGRLTVVSLSSSGTSVKTKWNCICDCGNARVVTGVALKSGDTRSCGCYRKEVLRNLYTTHGMRKTRIYQIWASMIARCTNKKRNSYKYYGGRGITVCKRWLIFENFYADMGPSCREGLSLDRINNNLGYFLENCRWVTATEQAANRRPMTRENLSSKYLGVSWHKSSSRWHVCVIANKEKKHVGSFVSELFAAIAYDNYIFDNQLIGRMTNFRGVCGG